MKTSTQDFVQLIKMENELNQRSFLDDGFKIKKKSQNNMNEESMMIDATNKSRNIMNDTVVYLKVNDMNVNKVASLY